jgi:hypothetical protein
VLRGSRQAVGVGREAFLLWAWRALIRSRTLNCHPQLDRVFNYLAHLGDDLVLIAHIFKPQGASFSTNDIDDVLHRRDQCARLCGWDVYGPTPRILLFLVAEHAKQLKLTDQLTAYLATKPEISRYRLQCSFSYGISLTELDDKDEFVHLYERDLPQMRGAKPKPID